MKRRKKRTERRQEKARQRNKNVRRRIRERHEIKGRVSREGNWKKNNTIPDYGDKTLKSKTVAELILRSRLWLAAAFGMLVGCCLKASKDRSSIYRTTRNRRS